MPSSSSWTDAMVGHRVFCTFGDCPCGNAPFDATYLWECLDGAPPSTHLVSLGHRCFLQCCAAPKDVTTSRCTCNLVMRVAGRFTEDERAGFSCYSRVELAQQRGLEIGQDASATLNKDVLVTTRGRQVRTFGALAEPPLSECLFDVDVAAVASRFVLDQCKSDNLFVFKSYLVLGGAIVGWAQSSPFTIAIKAPIAVKPPLSMSIPAPLLEFIAICDCSSPHFSPDYFRMNKAFGRKELRCFPHCCPHHMPYNSCNVPLHVRLVFGNPRLCIVAARVELAISTLKLGDSVAMDALDHDSNWITGTTQVAGWLATIEIQKNTEKSALVGCIRHSFCRVERRK
ncbi:hypothetical protein, variant [Aphanomyces astaci]|uniref:Uncharacterized protein n=1 Tax=Aphanomyces astaci TaxID=112090 RepID=W4GD00_APHAT|nr:hypothetical protein, variant [Aphanomyces astaci]ETV77547.1 hypothetical protein, variant [Aphanomyces astaci]|eukprot:XP_009832657.1 hypothetical protein, variant [Aphanomyces astaci]